jgi:2-polyprenyl-6-methoxyphenol hydroxylase-like FAD-dependent oxidoreductase
VVRGPSSPPPTRETEETLKHEERPAYKKTIGWNGEANKLKLLEVYKDFDSSLLALLDKAEAKSLKAWELLDMDVLSTWVQDRLALLGDAAHPFLPRK